MKLQVWVEYVVNPCVSDVDKTHHLFKYSVSKFVTSPDFLMNMM